MIKKKTFKTYNLYPVTTDNYTLISDKQKIDRNKFGVLLQGPLKIKNDFTLETIKLYQKNFDGCPIVVSTWEGEDLETIKKIKRLNNVEVIQSPQPPRSFQNMNNLIISSRNGCINLMERGVDYLLKTRTDQRMYETNIPEYLINLLSLYPMKEEDNIKQKQRLITTSFNSFKYRLYELSDMLIFGTVYDVMLYWDCPLDEMNRNANATLLEFCKNRPSEIYFTTSFLERTGWNIKWTLRDSWEAYAKRFLIVDDYSLGFYWGKYSMLSRPFRPIFNQVDILEELTYKEWLNLFINISKPDFYVPEFYVQHALISKDGLNETHIETVCNLSPTGMKIVNKFDLSSFDIASSITNNTSLYITDKTIKDVEKEMLLKNKALIIVLWDELKKISSIPPELRDRIILCKDNEIDFASLRIFPMKRR